MDITVSQKDICTLVAKASGKLNLDTAVEYGTDIKDAIYAVDKEIKEFILDFSEISLVSSIGLKVILEIYKALQEKGITLVISSVSDELKKSFKMVGFDKFIVFR